MLATGFFLYLLAQLALKRIRAPVAGHQTGIMTTVLLGITIADLAIVVTIAGYCGAHLGMRRESPFARTSHLPGAPS
jgi:hypothetical protein